MSNESDAGLDLRQSLSMLFGTPLAVYEWPDSDGLNAALKELVLAREAADETGHGTRSNAGGWQSPGNLVTWKEPCIRTLKQRMEDMVFALTGQLLRPDSGERSFRLVIDAWPNVNRNGDYNVVHTHPNCMWSGVYYVDPGDPQASVPYSGLLELLDPRESANYIQVRNTVLDARTFIENRPGRMILFPSWLKHMVHPYVGNGARISVAFNANVIEDELAR